MKKLFLFLFISILLCSCNAQRIDYNKDAKIFLKWFFNSRSEKVISLQPIAVDTALIKDSLISRGLTINDKEIKSQLNNASKLLLSAELSSSKRFLDIAAINAQKLTYLQISPPLFVKDEVWIKTEMFCGDLCGQGTFLIYKKVNNEYKLIDAIELWIS